MKLPTKGIITTRNWLMAPNGERYAYWYSEEWRVVIDKEFPLADFHSREKWSLLALKNGNVVCIIPGCEICGLIMADKCPDKTYSVPHKEDEPDTPPGIFNLTEGKWYK